MLAIPIYFFLFAYFAFLLIFAFFSVVNIAHMFHTGALTLISFGVTLIMSLAVLMIFYVTWFFLQNIDWQQTITIFDKAWFVAGNNYF